MHKRSSLILLVLLAVGVVTLASCGGLPPMQLVVIISPTPDPRVIIITVTPDPALQPPFTVVPATATAEPPTPVPALPPSPTADQSLQPQPTPTLSAFPTETRAQIYIAQQDFQNGYMFWISTTNPKVVWVLIKDQGNPNQGEWRIYQDTFVDGQQEFDPNLNPPAADLYQPRRGFGKLWRETPGLRETLGWATTPEFALNTPYVYQPGGYLDNDGKYVPGPGKHFLTSLGRQTFAFTESAQGFGRWERIN